MLAPHLHRSERALAQALVRDRAHARQHQVGAAAHELAHGLRDDEKGQCVRRRPTHTHTHTHTYVCTYILRPN